MTTAFQREIKATRNLKRSVDNRRRGMDSGVGIAWHRGEQSGIYEAYKVIRKEYPEAARTILGNFGMNKQGNIVIKFGKK